MRLTSWRQPGFAFPATVWSLARPRLGELECHQGQREHCRRGEDWVHMTNPGGAEGRVGRREKGHPDRGAASHVCDTCVQAVVSFVRYKKYAESAQ
jgi:hypothetical protein